jgi:putative ABC transport system permease protein
MLKNYFKLAWRNLIKNRQFTFLNLLGLSTGMACAILIYFWVSDELQVNKFNTNGNRIYQVMQPSTNGNGAIENTPGLLADALQKEIPEVEYAASVIPSTWFSNKGLFSVADQHIRADGGFVSGNFFKIFTCRFVDGDANQLFLDKNDIAISRDFALKLFGRTTNIIGKSIEWSQQGFDENYVVSAVFERFPSNSTLQFDAIFSYEQFLDKNPKLLNWSNNDPNTYVLLRKEVNADVFNKKIAAFIKSKDNQSDEA